MSKLSFRAKALDSSKPLAIYHSKEVDISHINRIVPKMPTGMEKEEESEHHLQRALAAGQAIPVPEVFNVQDKDRYKRCYPDKIKMPRQLIHMQPFTMQNDIPEYDMDLADEEWLSQQEGKLKITPLQFEDMIDKFERSCGTTAITLNDARSILKNVDASVVTSVYDYWLQKRISTQQPFIPQVKTDKGGGSNNNPYVAFRRRVERMTTRRNRKNDEVSYQKIVKLRRDLGRALDLFAMLKKREEAKKQYLQLGVSIFEKRFEMGDFSGSLLSDAARVASQKVSRPTFQPLTSANMAPISPASWTKEERKRPYKRRKRQPETSPSVASPPEELVLPEEAQFEAEEKFRFVRTVNCDFQPPIPFGSYEDHRSRARGGKVSFSNWTGMARRRIGRGGRVIYDRLHWDSLTPPHSPTRFDEPKLDQYFRPVSPVEEPEVLDEEEFILPKNVYIGFEDSENVMHFDLDNTDDFSYDFNLEPPLELEDAPPVSSKWTRSSKSQDLELKLPVIGDEISDDGSVGTSSDEIRLQLGNPVNEVF